LKKFLQGQHHPAATSGADGERALAVRGIWLLPRARIRRSYVAGNPTKSSTSRTYRDA
jgi:hypothetical protein